MPEGLIVVLIIVFAPWLIIKLGVKILVKIFNIEEETKKNLEEIRRKYTPKYKTIKAEYIPKSDAELKLIKDKYNSLNLYYDDIIKSPYFTSNVEEKISESNYDIENLFNSCIEKQDMRELMVYVEQYLSKNYISNKSINYLQFYVKGIILEYSTYRTWNETFAKNIIKAFLCVYKNGKNETPEKTNFEIKTMCASIVELLKMATETPFIPGMKNATEIMDIFEMLINIYCIFPIDILKEYFEEIIYLLEHKILNENEKERLSCISNFMEEVEEEVFNSGCVDPRKFKAYPIELYQHSKIDAIYIDYINKTEQIAIVSIDFIERTPCDFYFCFTFYDENKEKLLLNYQRESISTSVQYSNNSFNKCGMVRIRDVILGYPKNTKFIRVVTNEDIYNGVEYELPEIED